MARLAARPAKSTISKKRTLSDTTPSRQSKRVKSLENTPNGSQSTPKTSKYFEPDSEDGLELLSESEFEGAKDESGYEDEDEDAAPDSSSEELVEDDSSDGGQKIKKKKNGVRAGVGVTRRPADTPKELWRPGTKTGLGPGQQVVIKKPKAREAGKTPYADSRVHPNTLLFLKDLAQNNDREWLKSKSKSEDTLWQPSFWRTLPLLSSRRAVICVQSLRTLTRESTRLDTFISSSG
jgi:hypothetical protein